MLNAFTEVRENSDGVGFLVLIWTKKDSPLFTPIKRYKVWHFIKTFFQNFESVVFTSRCRRKLNWIPQFQVADIWLTQFLTYSGL